jgi:DNA polymerase I
MAVAVATGLAPPGATKDTHSAIRDLFKVAVLGLGYGMGTQTLADTTGLSYGQAEDLLSRFHQRFSRMRDFDAKVLQLASISGHQRTRLQWHRHIRRIIPGAGEDRTPGVATRESVRNFPIQANAAEMFRWAVVYAVEAGLPLVLLMHDAVMVHAPLRDLEDVMQETRACMAKASRLILQGEELRTSAEGLTAYPDRYRDPKGAPLWGTIREEMRQLTGIDIDPSDPVSPNATIVYPSVVGR